MRVNFAAVKDASPEAIKERQRETEPDLEECYSESVMIWDIETGPLPDAGKTFDESEVKLGNLKDPVKIQAALEKARQKHLKQAALDATTGEVLTIGFLFRGVFQYTDKPEADTLADFWKTFEDAASHGIRLPGWNIFDFDLPFLCQRSWILGVPIPGNLRSGRNREYWHECFIDLEEKWAFNPRDMVGVNPVSLAMGFGGKNGDGAFFHLLWKNDRPAALEYLKNDCKQEFLIGQRMRLF